MEVGFQVGVPYLDAVRVSAWRYEGIAMITIWVLWRCWRSFRERGITRVGCNSGITLQCLDIHYSTAGSPGEHDPLQKSDSL